MSIFEVRLLLTFVGIRLDGVQLVHLSFALPGAFACNAILRHALTEG